MEKYIHFNCEQLCHAHDAFTKIKISSDELGLRSINYNVVTNIRSVNRSLLVENLKYLKFDETFWIDNFIKNYQDDNSTTNLLKKETFCREMALTIDSLSILTIVAWFFLIICLVDLICDYFGYGFSIKLIEDLETNPDYSPGNKELAERREKSTGAMRRAKRRANNASNAQNNSENHELESLNDQ